jgi:gas vesicle structural protein
MAMEPSRAGGTVERSQESGLADVVNTILDKGVVVDIFARVSLVGIELLRVDARVVIASVDTYLRFAEAANRLDMGADEPMQLDDVIGSVGESGSKGVSKGKTEGALEAGAEKLEEILGTGDEEKEEVTSRRRESR